MVDRHTLAKHLCRPPVPATMRMDVWQFRASGGSLDNTPGGVGGEGALSETGPTPGGLAPNRVSYRDEGQSQKGGSQARTMLVSLMLRRNSHGNTCPVRR